MSDRLTITEGDTDMCVYGLDLLQKITKTQDQHDAVAALIKKLKPYCSAAFLSRRSADTASQPSPFGNDGKWVMSLCLGKVTYGADGRPAQMECFPGCVQERSGPDKELLLAWRDSNHGENVMVTASSLTWHENA